MLSSTVRLFMGFSIPYTDNDEGNVCALPLAGFYLNITPLVIDAQVYGTKLHHVSHKASYWRLFPSFSQYVSRSLFRFDAHK